MGFWGWHYTATATFANNLEVLCILDTDDQVAVTSLYADGGVTAPDGFSTNFEMYAHFYTPATTGSQAVQTGIETPPVNPDPAAQCAQTVSFSSAVHWPVGGDNLCHEPGSGYTRVRLLLYPRGGGTFPRELVVSLNGGWSGDLGSQYCAYGTGPQGSTTSGIIVTTALLDLLLGAAGLPAWFEIGFDALVGKVLWGGDLCAGPPPPMPVFTNDDFLFGLGIPNPTSAGKWMTALESVAWPYFCACTPAPPGSPVPVSYPPPTAPKPDAAPAGPINIACTDTDMCTALNALARQLTALSSQVTYLRSDVTLIQRQGVPFGYVRGTSHGPLIGEGDFGVADILGLEVNYSAIPALPGRSAGDPDTYHQIGKISLGTSDGWRRSWMPTHSPYLILPVSGAFTRVGYTFPAGATATITELLREP